MGNFLKNKKTKIIFGLVGLYLLSAGTSYFVFSLLGKNLNNPLSPSGLEQKRAGVDVSGPKTEECPLNGKMFTKAERDIWETRRPLNIMIENHEDARPQSGLSSADVVYEALAEGGVSRFMGVFYCGVSERETQVGPVRSARVYYIDWASEYAKYPLYVHVGGANKPGPANAVGSNGNIDKFGWRLYNDLDQFSIGFPTFWRDYERLGRVVATEHTMYSSTDKLWKVAKDRGLTNKDKKEESWDKNFTKWKFADGVPSSGSTNKISFPFWEGYSTYAVEWNYDMTNNFYSRVNGGKTHTDFNTESPITASNIIVLFTKAKGPIDELKHMLYDTIGSGKALVFQNGTVIEGTWKKTARESRTKFTDKKGKEIAFVRGNIWIEVLDPTTKVDY